MQPTLLAPVMMLGWLPFTLSLFATMKARKAVAVSLVLGYLFLPAITYNFPGFPAFTKPIAISLPIFLGILIFDAQHLKKLSLCKLDIPIIIWVISPFMSSLSNGIGVYDGLSGSFRSMIEWGLPYAIGKIYFSDQRGLRELAQWIVIGGVIYIPFCIWEMQMSPQLNYYLYGFYPDVFRTTMRFGGYRPVVFLQHGIALGMWMMSAILMGFWLWRTKAVKLLYGIPIGLHLTALFITFCNCRAIGAIVLFVGGIFSSYVIRSFGWKSIVVCLALIPPIYIVSRDRDIGVLETDRLVEFASNVSEERSRSLFGRLHFEEMLVEKAWKRPVLGWGSWGRNRIKDEEGNDISVTDGFWIIVFGSRGLVGLLSIGLVLLLPTVTFWRKCRFLDWREPHLAPMVGFIIILPLYTIDCLMNSFPCLVFTTVAGGLVGWLSSSDDGTLSKLE